MGTWGLASIVAVLAGSPAVDTQGQTLTARDDFWSPASVTVQAGETVTWAHGGQNDHDLLVDGREVVAPGKGACPPARAGCARSRFRITRGKR